MTLLRSQRQDGVLDLRIDGPEARNAFTLETLEALTRALEAAAGDASVRAVLLNGSEEVFSAGLVLEAFGDKARAYEEKAWEALDALEAFGKPVLACVRGPAVGFALALLARCDIVYASSQAVFSLPFAALGLSPNYGLAERLAFSKKAAEKLLLSEPFDAEDAFFMGLVSAVLDGEALEARVRAAANRLSQMPPAALAETKSLLKAARGGRPASLRKLEATTFETLLAGPDAAEALAAFREGRKPVFGRDS